MKRRQFIQGAGTGSAFGAMSLLSGCASFGSNSSAKVVVVGGGYGGATAAKYVRMWSNYGIDVTLIEPNTSFVSCPMSNLVIGGSKTLADLTTPYSNLVKKHGVTLVQDHVSKIDADKKSITLANGPTLPYDKLVLSPGVDLCRALWAHRRWPDHGLRVAAESGGTAHGGLVVAAA